MDDTNGDSQDERKRLMEEHKKQMEIINKDFPVEEIIKKQEELKKQEEKEAPALSGGLKPREEEGTPSETTKKMEEEKKTVPIAETVKTAVGDVGKQLEVQEDFARHGKLVEEKIHLEQDLKGISERINQINSEMGIILKKYGGAT